MTVASFLDRLAAHALAAARSPDRDRHLVGRRDPPARRARSAAYSPRCDRRRDARGDACLQPGARAAARVDAEGARVAAGSDPAGATRRPWRISSAGLLEHARTVTIPGPGGEIPLRVLEAPESRGAYLHFHGGGWTIGGADLQDPHLGELAAATGLTVISVDYRLAPEHPYPAGADDSEAAALWLLEHRDGRLTIGGDSAGAQLAVVSLLRLRDRHGISPRAFSAANLVFGPFDLTGTPSRRLWGDRELVLSSPLMDWFADCFLPGMSDSDRREPGHLAALRRPARPAACPLLVWDAGSAARRLPVHGGALARRGERGSAQSVARGCAWLHRVPDRDRQALPRRAE